MQEDEKYMLRCLELGARAMGQVAPNPMVGCVIVHKGKIIGEGFHQAFGQAHAEVNAIHSVADKKLLKNSVLYVNLEPCSHFGKTPPCADLIIEKGIKKVVIGTRDINPLVGGKGIEMLRKEGLEVITGVLENECLELNKRFFTFHEKKRPFVILKWAQTEDGFIDGLRSSGQVGKQLQISHEKTSVEVHKWRSEEQALLIGTTTALLDNPQLNVRHVEGKSPIRVVIDKDLKIPENFHLMDGSFPTLLFTHLRKPDAVEQKGKYEIEYITSSVNEPLIENILYSLYERNIQSVLVEGGARLINSFIELDEWDEARVILGPMKIQEGVRAPVLSDDLIIRQTHIADDFITFYSNRK